MAFFISNQCVICQRCALACPQHAISFDGEIYVIDPSRCVDCGKCAQLCLVDAAQPEGYIEPQVNKHEEVWEDKCDLVVIGSGPSGLCAAIRSTEAGHKVIVLEAAKRFGGAGTFPGFMTLFGTKWEKDAGLKDRTNDYINAAMNNTRCSLDQSLINHAFRAIPQWFDWFCTWGDAQECFALQDTDFGRMVDLNLEKHHMAGEFVTGKYLQRAKELGIDMRSQHRAVEFIMEGNRIRGVRAQEPGGEIIIHCKACMVATGNMGSCEDIEKYEPLFAKADHFRSPHLLPTDRGDSVKMAEKAGIPIADDIVPHYFGALPLGIDPEIMKQGSRHEGLRVNLNGERFTNECVERNTSLNQLVHQPRCISYNIIDSKILQQDVLPTIKYPECSGATIIFGIPKEGEEKPRASFLGIPIQYGKDGKPLQMVMDKIGFQDDLKKMEKKPVDLEHLRELSHMKGRHVCMADTLEDLADQMGVPREKLVETVGRYNGLCEKKQDDDFCKDPDYLFPINQPPYFAFKACLGSDGVFGGLRVDSYCRVLGSNGPVEGLYCGGDAASGIHLKENHRRTEAMADFTWANASGFLAASDIHRYLTEE